jgi:hypothetical protein
MKLLKFRVRQSNKDPQYDHFVEDKITIANAVKNYILDQKNQDFWRQPRANDTEYKYHIMLWTWLKDKHWNDIYEWDILATPHSIKTVKWSNSDCAFNVVKYWIEKREIIGNIYENKI